jgi:hypothetical protein
MGISTEEAMGDVGGKPPWWCRKLHVRRRFPRYDGNTYEVNTVCTKGTLGGERRGD